LKPNHGFEETCVLKLPDRYPTEQGLKQSSSFCLSFKRILPDRYPTEQGLKHGAYSGENGIWELPDRYPTEQGLKLE